MPWPKGNEETLQHKIWTALKDLGQDDKDGWFVYDAKGRRILAERLGLDSDSAEMLTKNVSNMIRFGFLQDIRDGRTIIGVKPTEKQPWFSHDAMVKHLRNTNGTKSRAPKAVINGAITTPTETKNGEQVDETKPVIRRESEYLPENYSVPNFLNIPTPNLTQYSSAKSWVEEIGNGSPYLKVEFQSNPMGEEALQLADALHRAQELLRERTTMLNTANRERNYLVKVRNPQLTKALNDAGVMVKHGEK